MRQVLYTITALFFLTSQAYADNGIVSVRSSHEVKATADRLENTLKELGSDHGERLTIKDVC
jgi:hypothetical protein